MTDVNGGFPRLVSRLGNSAGRVRRASSHAATGGPRPFPSCAAVPSPPPPVSLSWWAGEESDPSQGFLGPGPPPPACSAAPPRPAGQTQASAVCTCKGCWEVRGSRSRRTRGWMGGTRRLPPPRPAQPFLSRLVPPRGAGSRSAKQEGEGPPERGAARQRGACRPGLSRQLRSVSVAPAERATTPTGPKAAPGIIAVSVGGVGGGRSGWRGRPAADPTVGHSCPCDSQANPRPP